ncbi:hypothetical protein HHI36_008100 [Cryptolaemus montrouzieri]|uniref:Vacuolar protein sorting-associated protein 13 VPS13 adaptor binding domain-containing protein n=1 Tax=Cryptolaemus montrouzieri TaxID=559131 RepID=A0ABD2MRH1_9CUCU
MNFKTKKEQPEEYLLKNKEVIDLGMPQDSEQHYKDDLRAGAFQFVDSTTNNIDEMPLPYQVMFWNKKIAAMAWRYPQPRCLTKVRVFPVPLKVTVECEENIKISCCLEYWSDCHASFISYAQFDLPENEILHLILPLGKPHPPFACIWRVELSISKCNDENMDIFSFFSPRALAACLRVDSYFCRSLIPNLNVALSITRLHVALYTRFDKEKYKILPKFLKDYSPDMMFPSNHCFSEVTFNNLKLYTSSWDLSVFLIDLNTSFKLSVLDYAFLTMQEMMKSTGFRLETSIAKTCNIHCISKSISVNFSPSIAHTLAISTELWNQNYLGFTKKNEEDLDFLIVTRFVICNDTNVPLKFGQIHTDEKIVLMPKYFNLYCWRSQKHKQQLRVSLESKETWSEPFSLNIGSLIIEVNKKKKLTLNLTIIALSATQYQVIFSGQLVIANMLLEHFELKVIPEGHIDNRKIINQVVGGSSTTTAMVINFEKAYFLRLRFYALDTSWTGDIPLMEHSKSVQPWLVKVPLLEKGQFLSIWCRVVVQEFANGKRMLAMLWPLFTIKSNLPIITKVHIETPTLKYCGEIMVEGQGKVQQLYCPGTIDHSHQLTFQLENVSPSPNPYVPLNYSLIDHDNFFKKMDNINIQDIREALKTYNEVKWPYFGEELDQVEWVIGEQPETHVQIKYHNSCQYSSSLMVELLPWCLLVNTLGCTIGIKTDGMELCILRHNGIVAPPKMEENFNIFVFINNEKFTSDPLQFAKPANWSQNFYMPKILGIIPTEGTVVSNVKCNKHICRLSIKSFKADEIRLLKISSTHIVCNNTGFVLYMMCLSVPNKDRIYTLPHHSECNITTVTPEIYEKNQGLSVTQWYNLEKQTDQNNSIEQVFYMAFSLEPSLGWSKPLRVDEIFVRKTISVMSEVEPIPLAVTSYDIKGQLFIGVHHDTRPQIFIENDCDVTLYCGQSREGEDLGVLPEVEHFKWFCEIKNGGSNYYSMTGLIDKFPDIAPNSVHENLVFAKDPHGLLAGDTWSSSVNVTDDTDQYVKIPFHGDVRIVVKNSSCLTHIKIESVSKIEINAKDIRSRLLEIEEITKILPEPEHGGLGIMHSLSAEAIHSLLSDNKKLDLHASMNNMWTPTKVEQDYHPLKRRSSDSHIGLDRHKGKKLLCSTIPMMEDWQSLKMIVYVNEFNFTLWSDIEMKTGEVGELAALVCDNIAISTMQSETMQINLYVQNLQLDNMLFSKKHYDFPVVILIKEPKNDCKINSLNISIETLFEEIKECAALRFTLIMDTWMDPTNHKVSGIQELKFSLQPFCCYLEDTYLSFFSEYMNIFLPTNLIYIPPPFKRNFTIDQPFYVNIPAIVLWQSVVQAHPLTIRHLMIEPITLMLSIHSSMKMYLALDQSPLFFVEFERKRVFTNAYRLGHTLTMHYLSGAIFRAGWMVSSLEILGSPVGLARAMGSGLKDFVAMPFRGLLQGPVEFLHGVTHGSASLMRHVTAGTLQSFTKMASSVARNLDYLTLDEEHVRRAEEQRRQRPSGVTEGLVQGLTGLGISILGAIGGIAHHPLQSVISDGGSPRSLAAGLGLGIVGIITKPLSGAAELLALTGQGLLQGAGWNNLPEQRNQPVLHNMFSSSSSILKYEWKITSTNDYNCKYIHVADATSIASDAQYTSVALIITNKNLVIINLDDDVIQDTISLSELEAVKGNGDPNLLSLELVPRQTTVLKVVDELNIEMDPTSRARVADYVKNTLGLLQVTNHSREPSEMSISPLSSPGGRNDENAESKTVFTFYVNPQDRNYFLCLLSIAKHEHLNSYNNYPVLYETEL